MEAPVKATAFALMNKRGHLCEELPYWEIQSEPIPHIILSDGSVASAIAVTPIDIECFDEARINQLTFGLRSFLNSLPEGMSAQFFVRIENDFENRLNEHGSLRSTPIALLNQLDEARIESIKRLIHDGHLFQPKLYLSLRTEGVKRPTAFSISQTKKFSSDFEQNYGDRIQSLAQAFDSVISNLTSLGFTAEKLTRDDLVKLLYQYLNPSRSASVSPPVINPRATAVDGDSPRGQLVFGDLVLEKDDFVLDQKRTRVLTLKTLPEMTYAGMMSAFLALPFRFELIFGLKVPDQAKEMRGLEQKRRMAHSLAASTSNRVNDLESESRLSQTTNLIREIIETGQKIFQAELMIVLRAESTAQALKTLNFQTKEILSRFKMLSGSEGIQESVGAWKVFKSDLPLAPISFVRSKRMKTNNLADFLPLYGPSSGDNKPMCLLSTRLDGIYSFNPYDPKLTNYNMLVTGSSGSGKSFANNFLMLQQIARGTRVFIIDIGGSYRKMTELLGGQYFEINLSDTYAINPFDLPDPSVAPSGERLKGLVSILEQMVVDEGEKLSRLDRVQLEQGLTEIFNSARENKNPKSPHLSDFARLCAKSNDDSLKRIGKLLFPWVGDTPYGRLLDRDGRIKVDAPVVAFDLKGLSQHPDLQSVMILILTNFILDQVERDRSTQKRVIIDEAWELLKSPAASSFMEYSARTFRKTGSGISFISQGLDEFINSAVGPAIINNTATKLIMLQKGNTKILSDTLKLNSQELRLIQSLEQRKGQFSEGFLMEGESRAVVRIRPSPLEYWISTSDARDNEYIQNQMVAGQTLEKAIAKAAETLPFGVAMSDIPGGVVA